jgi:uncharacterized protein YggE
MTPFKLSVAQSTLVEEVFIVKRRTRLLAVVVLTLLIAIVATGCSVGASTPMVVSAAPNQPASGITVIGEGKVSAAPDVARITLGVETTGATAKAAMDDNNAKMNQVVAKIKALGVAEKDIQTSGINLYPVYETKPDRTTTVAPAAPTSSASASTGAAVAPVPAVAPAPAAPVSTEPTISGYRASNQVTITVNDIKQAPAVLDGVVGVGANSVSGLQFGIKDDSKLKQAALDQAAKQTKGKADAIASALGKSVVGIVSVQEDVTYSPMPVRAAAAGMAKDSLESVSVSPGELVINARIQATYAIQ